MLSNIKFISGCTTEIAPATRPAPAPRKFLGWPRRISALTKEIQTTKNEEETKN